MGWGGRGRGRGAAKGKDGQEKLGSPAESTSQHGDLHLLLGPHVHQHHPLSCARRTSTNRDGEWRTCGIAAAKARVLLGIARGEQSQRTRSQANYASVLRHARTHSGVFYPLAQHLSESRNTGLCWSTLVGVFRCACGDSRCGKAWF